MTGATPSPSTRGFRIVSALELLFGAFVVIGHNVFHVVPNEVPILFVIGLLSYRLRDRGYAAMGLSRPASWTRTIQIAVAAAALRIVMGEYVIDPITSRFWPPAVAPALAGDIPGNVRMASLALLIVWTFAAFGEEIAYRGYLLGRAADLGGRSSAAYLFGVVFVSILFGYGHFYKGPSGIVDSGVAGLILGIAFLVSGRNLWACILAHGLIDTFGIVAIYNGWAT